MEHAQILIIFLVASLVIMLVVAGIRREMARQKALASLAKRLGFTLSRGEDAGVAERFEFLNWLQEGSNRYAENVLRGVYYEHNVLVFDYHYETYRQTDKGRQTTHHWSSIYLLELPIVAPGLRMYPENFLHRIGQALGGSDIDFESVEFSRAFVVQCRDKKFAYDVMHPRMMSYLLRHQKLDLEMEQNFAALSYPEIIQAEHIEARLDILVELREMLPEYLLQR